MLRIPQQDDRWKLRSEMRALTNMRRTSRLVLRRAIMSLSNLSANALYFLQKSRFVPKERLAGISESVVRVESSTSMSCTVDIPGCRGSLVVSAM